MSVMLSNEPKGRSALRCYAAAVERTCSVTADFYLAPLTLYPSQGVALPVILIRALVSPRPVAVHTEIPAIVSGSTLAWEFPV